MNLRLIKILVPLLLFIFISTFFISQYSKKSFEDILGTKETNVTKVFVMNGNNGHSVETINKAKIKEIISLLNNRYYSKSFDQAGRTGYSYYYDFYSGDKLILRITGNGNFVKVNETYYNVSKEISVDTFNKWFNSLPVNTNNN